MNQRTKDALKAQINELLAEHTVAVEYGMLAAIERRDGESEYYEHLSRTAHARMDTANATHRAIVELIDKL